MRKSSFPLAAIPVLAAALALGVGCAHTPGGQGAGAAASTTTRSGNGSATTSSTTAGMSAGASVVTPDTTVVATRLHKLASGLQYEDMVVGNGKMADPGLTVTVHYTGWLTDGTKFDSSVDRGQPFTFQLGAGQVIPGWDEGVKGMRVGGKRKLTIPPDLGYGARGAGPIPPNSTLVFDVELLDVK